MSEYEVKVERRDAQPSMVIRASSSFERIGEDLGRIFPSVYQHVAENGGEFAGPPFARYLSMDEGQIELEAGITVVRHTTTKDDIEQSELPGGEMAITWHVGPFDTISSAYSALEQWMGANGKSMAGAPWEVYWTDPGEEPDPAKFRTEVVWPVTDT